MRFADIAQLSDHQIHRILFRPRDDDGNLIRASDTPQGPQVSYAEAVTQAWRDVGATDAEIRERWAKFQADNPNFRG